MISPSRVQSRPLVLPLLAVLAGAVVLPAHAQDVDQRDDRFTLRLSAFYPEAKFGLSGDGTATDGNETIVFSGGDTANFGNVWRPRGAIGFRISDRQALVGNYYDYSDDDEISYPGGRLGSDPSGVEIPELNARGEASFRLGNLNYEYSFVRTPAFQWGVGVGVTYGQLELKADASTAATDEVPAQTASLRWKEDGFSPGVHTRVTWRPGDRWRVGLEGQYLDANWGDIIDEDGHFERAGLIVEYLVSERVGIHVGYDWFRLKLKDSYRATIPADEIGLSPIQINGGIEGDLKVQGPMAGLTFRF